MIGSSLIRTDCCHHNAQSDTNADALRYLEARTQIDPQLAISVRSTVPYYGAHLSVDLSLSAFCACQVDKHSQVTNSQSSAIQKVWWMQVNAVIDDKDWTAAVESQDQQMPRFDFVATAVVSAVANSDPDAHRRMS